MCCCVLDVKGMQVGVPFSRLMVVLLLAFSMFTAGIGAIDGSTVYANKPEDLQPEMQKFVKFNDDFMEVLVLIV